MSGERPANKQDTEDSASADKPVAQGKTPKGRSKDKPDGKGTSGGKPTTRSKKPEATSTKQTPGFAEGNSVLNNYGLSVSGRKERVLSAVKTDKYFHFVEQSWNQLVLLKPHLAERFSFAEFRHASALQLFNRIESVKFEVLGVKPTSKTRIPLPRDTKVFQPIWSILANIGFVDDDELRVLYIPDSTLPKSADLTDPEDIENLLSCTLYDWHSSWKDVQNARNTRKTYQSRDGYTPITVTNEAPSLTREQLIKQISEQRRAVILADERAESEEYELHDGFLYKIDSKQSSPKGKEKEDSERPSSSRGTRCWGPETARQKLESLFADARRAKAERITPRFDASYRIDAYTISDGSVVTDPGAYGEWVHWDPQLWLDYEQFVEIVTPLALFSLSMPAEATGTYAWLLPVEKREDDDAHVSARLPKASIAPTTWILSLLLQSSTLPYDRRSTFYVETDRLSNVLGLRQRYIRAAIKDPSAVEHYGTY